MKESDGKSFKCPFCNQIMSITGSTFREKKLNFYYLQNEVFRINQRFLSLRFYKCPNANCDKESAYIEGYNDDYEGIYFPIYPSIICNQYPDYIPKTIIDDYYEACAIKNLSPKSSATLCRRCLQSMIHDFWGIKENNLKTEIDKIKSKTDIGVWNAIDAIRQIGNIGAHMEKDINTIIDIEPNEAELLIRLIEYLIDKWYIKRNEDQLMIDSIIDLNKNKQEQRK